MPLRRISLEPGCVPGAMVCAGLLMGCSDGGVSDSGQASSGQELIDYGDTPREIFSCTRCHAAPAADLLPRDEWPMILQNMKNLNADYQLAIPLTEEEWQMAAQYYQRAPLSIPMAPVDHAESLLNFRRRTIGQAAETTDLTNPPIISSINVQDLDEDARPDLLISDPQHGELRWLSESEPGTWQERSLTQVVAPARTAVADFHGDGAPDIAIAVLGSMTPTAEAVGSIVLLNNQSNQGIRVQTILQDLARVADVRAGDMDGDGDMDLVYAAFGLYKRGQVGWLENDDGQFKQHIVYSNNGAGHAPIADLDGDGDLDIVVLISQQHEIVILLENDGSGAFEVHELFRADHPIFGFADASITDLDQDGDEDVLLANGDALDQVAYPKSWHGVRWLENTGGLQFTMHEIASYYGAYCARAGDMDRDGDLDIVVTSMMNDWEDRRRQSIIWLENDGAMQFTKRGIDVSPTCLVTLELVDMDGNGWLDIIAGPMYVMEPYVRMGRVTAFMNMGLPED